MEVILGVDQKPYGDGFGERARNSDRKPQDGQGGAKVCEPYDFGGYGSRPAPKYST
jgi:hypothetical protein